MNISRAVLRTITLLAFTVVFALMASVMAYRYIKQREAMLEKERQRLAAKMADYPDPVQAIVAAQDIAEGTKLDASHLAAAPIPQIYLQPYSVQSVNEVLGLVTVAPIAKGEQILSNKLRRADEAPRAATLSSATPQGRRAVTIIVDSITGVGGFIEPKDKVDILWTVNLPSGGGQEGGGGQVVTLTLFQEVPVLAVGGDTSGVSAPRARQNEQQASTQGGQFMVTLALPPQDTSLLLFARESGRIQLSLRPRNETGALAIPPANINTLMERVMGAPAAKPEQPVGRPTRQVEVYKGLKRDVVDVPEGQP